jgi:hypothetical protein
MGFTGRTVTMEIQALLVFRASLASQESMELLGRREHQERLVRRELWELPEVQDHQDRLVPRVNLK